MSSDGEVTKRDTEIVHEECDLAASDARKLDANGDGRADVTLVGGSPEKCRAVDLNFDGLVDRFSYLDGSGQIRRQESDYDRDGRIDEIALFKNGQLVETQRATTLDNRLDTWHYYEAGKLARTERDSNGDAIIDQWWEYPNSGCPLIHSDVNSDGRPDPGASIDYCKETGYVPPERNETPPPAGPDFQTPTNTVEEVDSRPMGEGEGSAEGGTAAPAEGGE